MIPPLKFKFPEIPQLNFLIDLQGQSLYHKWLELGLGTGDYAAFLEWLRLKGDKGASAYDVAVELGFVGTQAEWVASLKGNNGKSAYQSYLDTTTDNPPMSEAAWANQIGNINTALETILAIEV